jgi:hypothetical protein
VLQTMQVARSGAVLMTLPFAVGRVGSVSSSRAVGSQVPSGWPRLGLDNDSSDPRRPAEHARFAPEQVHIGQAVPPNTSMIARSSKILPESRTASDLRHNASAVDSARSMPLALISSIGSNPSYR